MRKDIPNPFYQAETSTEAMEAAEGGRHETEGCVVEISGETATPVLQQANNGSQNTEEKAGK